MVTNQTSVARAVGPGVTMLSTDFSFQNLVFWNLFWIFSNKNHLKIHRKLQPENCSAFPEVHESSGPHYCD